MNNLINYANLNVPYYSERKINELERLDDIIYIPILTKNHIRNNRDYLVAKTANIRSHLWRGNTSGSTGSPLSFYKDKKSMKSERESYDSYYKFLGCDISKNRVRISGVKIACFDKKKPPYWVYIDKYKQLQCSAYHISKNSYKQYLNEFKKREAEFGTDSHLVDGFRMLC